MIEEQQEEQQQQKQETIFIPTSYDQIERVMHELEPYVLPYDIFCDFGSGDGRVCRAFASHFRDMFPKVFGFENDRNLNAIAEQNIVQNGQYILHDVYFHLRDFLKQKSTIVDILRRAHALEPRNKQIIAFASLGDPESQMKLMSMLLGDLGDLVNVIIINFRYEPIEHRIVQVIQPPGLSEHLLIMHGNIETLKKHTVEELMLDYHRMHYGAISNEVYFDPDIYIYHKPKQAASGGGGNPVP